MPFNFLGDLYKTEIVEQVAEKGFNISSVRQLNKILEEMGIIEHIGRDWLTTDKGLPYQIYKGKVFNADGWHPEIVAAVCDFLKNKR